MAKIVFPTTGAPYRGFIGEVRGWLNRIATYTGKSPGAVSVVQAHIAALLSAIGTVAATVVNAGQSISVKFGSAGLTTAGTATVTGTTLTNVLLPGGNALLQNGIAVTTPVTGTYATKITPTVVNGVVTGIVLS